MRRTIPQSMTLFAMLLAQTGAATAASSIVEATPIAGAPHGSHAFTIRYGSVGVDGRPDRVTGVLVVPDGTAPRDGWPVVAWAHGTTGIEDRCAPSIAAPFAPIRPLAALIARGFVVVATDYTGLCTPGAHPFLVGDAAARAVLDSVRAARAFRPAHAGVRFAVWGESQGGHAALFTGQMARAYAPELKLVGVAAAAPPTDLTANLTGGADPTARAVLTAFTAASWSQIYHAPLAKIANPVGRDLIHRLAGNCTLGGGMKIATMIGIVRLRRQLRGVNLAAVEPWAGLLKRNSAGGAPPGAPLLIAQGGADRIVAPDVTKSFARALCSRGAGVRWLPVDGGDHMSIAGRTAAPTIDWLADRFAGKPAPSDCARL